MDKIFLHQLEAKCIIGIFGWERKKRQRVLVDLEFPANVKKAAKSDHIRDAVDYKKIAKRTLGFVSESRFHLIETLAEKLAAVLLKEFRLKQVFVRVSKPGAVRHSKNVGIEVLRKAR
ncbi:MAG: dihydroneopterin aldolase [Candidatus Omnitrophota bacterium]|nr:dihydroneopterin aldolase [Candidatus Omnitrophota bacterium]